MRTPSGGPTIVLSGVVMVVVVVAVVAVVVVVEKRKGGLGRWGCRLGSGPVLSSWMVAAWLDVSTSAEVVDVRRVNVEP